MNTNDDDTADILAGLAALKERTRKLSSRKGRHIQQKLYMTEAERLGLTAMRAIIALHVGRNVSLPLVNRLALNDFADRCHRSLTNPVEAAKLRADILATRDERAVERKADAQKD
jgi:hypothetical protein